jgi:serine/threonine protein kinase
VTSGEDLDRVTPKDDLDRVTPKDDNDNDGDDKFDISKLFRDRATSIDLSACQSRQFSLGQDLILSDYVGSMGFDEVTDWEYYYPSEDDPTDRQVVQPNPFDPAKPKRTRTSSGSVVRLFRGEFVGQLGATISAQGLDRRVVVKEFTGALALKLAQSELEAAGKLQSDLLSKVDSAVKGEWIRAGSSRSAGSVMSRQDNSNLALLVKLLGQSNFLGIFGEVNLAELDGDLQPNDFYRALGVPPPKPDAVWVVYEYAGFTTLAGYAQPAEVRRSKIAPKKGFFGKLVQPPPVPAWPERANYVIKGIMKQAIEAVATVHESGIVHRSIGRNSILLSSKAMDKREAVSPYATMTNQLVVKLADFGFSGKYKDSTSNEEFCARARTFDLYFKKGENTIATTNFAIAEDMHALGFVFLGLLLSSLAEVPTPQYAMPPTDEDSLQRLLGDIFGKDVKGEFRDYVEAEEIWTKVVELLDQKDKAGWTVLETLLLAREKATKNKDTSQIFTVRGLLSNPFFN